MLVILSMQLYVQKLYAKCTKEHWDKKKFNLRIRIPQVKEKNHL